MQEKERETERERKRDKERERQKQRHRDRETQTQRENQLLHMTGNARKDHEKFRFSREASVDITLSFVLPKIHDEPVKLASMSQFTSHHLVSIIRALFIIPPQL